MRCEWVLAGDLLPFSEPSLVRKSVVVKLSGITRLDSVNSLGARLPRTLRGR